MTNATNYGILIIGGFYHSRKEMMNMAKYCSACHALVEEDTAKFCPHCGNSEFHNAEAVPEAQEVTVGGHEAAPEVNTVDSTVAPPVMQTTEPSCDGVNPEVQFSQPEFKPKKKFPVKRVVFAGIALALVAAIVLNFSFVSGWFVKIFRSDEAYFSFVEQKALSGYTDAYVKWYNNYLEGVKKDDASVETEIGFKLGDSGKTLLALVPESVGNFDWLDDTKIQLTTSIKNNKMSSDFGVKIANTDILSLMMVVDNSDQVILYAIKELTDDVLKIDLKELTGQAGLAGIKMSEITDALPDAKTVRSLANKYFKIALKNVKKASASTEKFEVGDISQNLTVIKADITEKLLYTAAKDVLKEAKKDKDIKKIVKDIEKALKKSNQLPEDTDLYDNLKSGIDSALDNMNDMLDDLDGSGEKFATWYDYVNKAHEIVGHKVVVGERDIAEYVKLKSGKKVEFEAYVPDVATVTGSGTESFGKRNMSYDIQIEDAGKVTLKLENFDINAPKNGKMEGTLRIIPDLQSFHIDLDDILPSSLADRISNFNSGSFKPELKLTLKSDAKNQKADYELLMNGNLVVGITATSKISKGKSVSLPKGNQIDATNQEDLIQFIQGLDMDALTKNLKKANLPDSWVEAVENFADRLEQSLSDRGDYVSFPDYKDYEDYDDYDDYEDYEDYEDADEAYDEASYEDWDYEF